MTDKYCSQESKQEKQGKYERKLESGGAVDLGRKQQTIGTTRCPANTRRQAWPEFCLSELHN